MLKKKNLHLTLKYLAKSSISFVFTQDQVDIIRGLRLSKCKVIIIMTSGPRAEICISLRLEQQCKNNVYIFL